MSRIYVLYDGRAEYDIDDAGIASIEDSLEDALAESEDYDYVCYSYEEVDTGSNSCKWEDERFEFSPSTRSMI